jgi:hypothetical protein
MDLIGIAPVKNNTASRLNLHEDPVDHVERLLITQ